MENKEKKSGSPTYLSLPKLEKLMELLTQRKLDKPNAAYFKTYGFSDSDAYLAISTIRFLGLIDESGSAVEEAKKLHLTGDSRKKEIEKIVRSAYAKLFEVTDKPFELSMDDLTNEFIHQYDMSGRVAKPAAQAFQKMCEYAGLLPEGTIQVRSERAPTKNSGEPKKEKGKQSKEEPKQTFAQSADTTVIPFADGKIGLHIPTVLLTKAVFGGDLGEELKELTAQLSKFATKHIESSEDRSVNE